MIVKGLLSQKWFYIVMIGLLIIFIQNNKLILHMHFIINVLLFMIPFLSIFFYLLLKGRKDKTYSLKENLIDAGGIAFFILFILKIMINFYIKSYSEDQKILIMRLPVSNLTSGRQDLIYFEFEGERYSLRYSNRDLEKQDVINNYNIELSYSPSVFDTYVIKNYRIVHK